MSWKHGACLAVTDVCLVYLKVVSTKPGLFQSCLTVITVPHSSSMCWPNCEFNTVLYNHDIFQSMDTTTKTLSCLLIQQLRHYPVCGYNTQDTIWFANTTTKLLSSLLIYQSRQCLVCRNSDQDTIQSVITAK